MLQQRTSYENAAHLPARLECRGSHTGMSTSSSPASTNPVTLSLPPQSFAQMGTLMSCAVASFRAPHFVIPGSPCAFSCPPHVLRRASRPDHRIHASVCAAGSRSLLQYQSTGICEILSFTTEVVFNSGLPVFWRPCLFKQLPYKSHDDAALLHRRLAPFHLLAAYQP